MSPRLITDDRLLAECRVDQFRGSGPGGQKRNKTSNAVRIVHKPTGIAATATESRSLAENKLRALRRLRIKLASDVREPINLQDFEPPDWFRAVCHDRRLQLSHRHEHYAAAAGLALDLFATLAGNPSAVAINLGISTSALLKLIGSESAWWTTANRWRADAGAEPLTTRR